MNERGEGIERLEDELEEQRTALATLERLALLGDIFIHANAGAQFLVRVTLRRGGASSAVGNDTLLGALDAARDLIPWAEQETREFDQLAETVAGTLSPEEQELLHRVCTGMFSSNLRLDQLELADRLRKRELVECCGVESRSGVPHRRTLLGDAVARLNEDDQAPSRVDVPAVVEARLRQGPTDRDGMDDDEGTD